MARGLFHLLLVALVASFPATATAASKKYVVMDTSPNNDVPYLSWADMTTTPPTLYRNVTIPTRGYYVASCIDTKRDAIRALWDDPTTGKTYLISYNYKTKQIIYDVAVMLQKGACGWAMCDESDGSVYTICAYDFSPLDATLVQLNSTTGTGKDTLQIGAPLPPDWAGGAKHFDKASRTLFFIWPTQIKSQPYECELVVMNLTANKAHTCPYTAWDYSALPSSIAWDSSRRLLWGVNISGGPSVHQNRPDPVDTQGHQFSFAPTSMRPPAPTEKAPQLDVYRNLFSWNVDTNTRHQATKNADSGYYFYGAGGQVNNGSLGEWVDWKADAFKWANLSTWDLKDGKRSVGQRVQHNIWPLTFWEWVDE